MTYITWLEEFNKTLKKYCPYFNELTDNSCLRYIYNNGYSPETGFSAWYNGIPI